MCKTPHIIKTAAVVIGKAKGRVGSVYTRIFLKIYLWIQGNANK